MKKYIIIFILALSNIYSFNFNERLAYSDEKIYFSMLLSNGQVVTISGQDNYLVYRYGTKNEIKMEFPAADIDPWSVFNMDYFQIDQSSNYYLNFHSEEFSYRIYEELYNGEVNVGIVIKDLSNGESYEFESSKDSLIGSLEEIYDLENMKKGEI